MGTTNTVKQQSSEEECNNCIIAFAWAETVTCDPIEIIYRPIYTFWPPDPVNVWPEYESFETADAYVNPPDWDKEQTQSLSPDCNISYSEPYACVSAATNVSHASGPKIEREETFSHIDTLSVDFYWYGARRNPLYPGTAGAPPYIRELVGPITVERNRRVYYVKEITTDIYSGRIQCTCGEPSECGCF
jgi:hypothetical protein